MGRESLKIKMENWMMAAARSQGSLGELQLVHADGSDAVKDERLVFDALIKERQLEGPQGYAVEVTVELYSTNRDAEQVDSIFDAVEDALIAPKALGAAQELFTTLEFFPENMTSADDRAQNTRTRSRVYPFVVVEK